MVELLGVPPGALTPFGLINDHAGLVTAVVDASLMNAEQLNFHPLVNDKSTGISPRQLLVFIESCGRKPEVIDLDAMP